MRSLFAAAVAAVIATGALATPSDAKTIDKTVIKPVGIHKVVKVKTIRTNTVVKVAPRKTFAKAIGCRHGFYRHHGRCVVFHGGHHG